MFEGRCRKGQKKPSEALLMIIEEMMQSSAAEIEHLPLERRDELLQEFQSRVGKIERGCQIFFDIFGDSANNFFSKLCPGTNHEAQKSSNVLFSNGTAELKNQFSLLILTLFEFFLLKRLVPQPLILFFDDFQVHHIFFLLFAKKIKTQLLK